MAVKVPCDSCKTEILEITSKMNGGLCHLCLKGSFECQICNKKVLITEGVNDEDKICLGCWQNNRETAVDDGLISVKEREHKDQDIVIVYFPNKITHRDKLQEYFDAIGKILSEQSPIVDLEEKTHFDSIIIRDINNYWLALGIIRGAAKSIFIDESYSVEGLMSETHSKYFDNNSNYPLPPGEKGYAQKKNSILIPILIILIIIDIVVNLIK